MDIRQTKQEENFIQMTNDKLTDSLIYNIIKKLELKMAMEQKYLEIRSPQLKILPKYMQKHLHSTVALGYLGLVMSTTLFLRFKARRPIKLSFYIPHVLIALSINEYERYKNIMNIDQQLSNQFKSYQRNTKSIIEEKKNRVKIYEQIKSINVVTFQKILQMLKYKPIY